VSIENQIKKLKDALLELEQSNIFGNDYSNLDQSCKDYLVFRKFRVADPLKVNGNITKEQELIDYFYARLQYKNKGNVVVFRHKERDMAVAKKFVRNRMEASNSTKAEAIRECSAILQLVIEREEEFNFTVPMFFGMFSKDNFSWVVEKAIEKINTEDYARSELMAEKIAEEFHRTHNIEGIIEENDGGVI